MPKTFKTSPGRAAAVSLLGDDHDYETDDPEELAAFIEDMEGIVGEEKEAAKRAAKDISDQREESGGSRSVGGEESTA